MNGATKTRAVTATLAVCGLVAIAVGSSALFTPVAFFASNGIALGESASLLSEVRSAGGANLAMGVLILAGAFVTRLRRTSALLTTSFYLAYGCARLLGIALDGMPSTNLVAAAFVELALGVVGAFVLTTLREAR